MSRKLLIFLCALLLCCSGCTKSINENAEKYRNGRCVAFYPANNEEVREYAVSLCESREERIYDYQKKKSGDLYAISYLDGRIFYVNEDDTKPELTMTGGEAILSNHLRYEMKKAGKDIAYTSQFWLDTAPDALDLSKITGLIEHDAITVYYEEYDQTVRLPMLFLKELTGIDPGTRQTDEDERLVYIDPERPMLAITYDDGPYKKVDTLLYDLFDRYGGRATFYSVGSRMSKSELDSIAYGISLGMEFGSHTENHENLGKLSANSAKRTVYEPIDYVKKKLGYEMKTYRPPYGVRNSDMEQIISIPAVLWSVDSKDWSNRDADITYDKIMDQIDNYDVILMHSLYMSSEQASEKLVPELIDRGYQLVTVTELMEQLGVEVSNITYFADETSIHYAMR